MRAVRILLILSVVAASGIALSTRFANEDLFLSFAAGRDVSEGGLGLPDTHSFTVQGEKWVNQAWLSHYFLYAAYAWLGASGPVLIKIVLFVVGLFAVFLQCRSLGISDGVASACLAAGIVAAAPFVGLRAENFGVFFFLGLALLLTVEPLPRLLRCLVIPLWVVLWANCHGSFMLGIGLVGIKAVLTTVRRISGASLGRADAPSAGEAVQWWLVTAVSVLLAATVNPFGADNLFMPFRQIGTADVTRYSADWLPLLSFGETHHGMLGGGSVYPYLFLVAAIALGIALLLIMTKYSPRAGKQAEALRGDRFMVFIIGAVSIVMAFRFRRLIAFSGFALIPVAGLVVTYLLARMGGVRAGEPGMPDKHRLATGAAAAALLVGLSAVAYRIAVVPYLPGNPFRPERTLSEELMSFNSFSQGLVRFMEQNELKERIFAGWDLSGYLMYRLPDVRLFMDLRDQSFYPPAVLRDYFTILGVMPGAGQNALELLDSYRVSAVVLSTGPIEFDTAMALMASKRWVCAYADPDALVLVRRESDASGAAAPQGPGREFLFPSDESRAYTLALNAHMTESRVPKSLAEDLKLRARERPWPNYYGLICWGIDDPRGCFSSDTVQFLGSEAQRLAGTDFRYPLGGRQILESLVTILRILEGNASRCGNAQAANTVRLPRVAAEERLDAWRRYYLGELF